LNFNHFLFREEKQERFRKTAMAMQEIISKKLYKAKHSTMEQYFKEVFKLSRASVYRFVDASRVLNVNILYEIYNYNTSIFIIKNIIYIYFF